MLHHKPCVCVCGLTVLMCGCDQLCMEIWLACGCKTVSIHVNLHVLSCTHNEIHVLISIIMYIHVYKFVCAKFLSAKHNIKRLLLYFLSLWYV